MSKQPPSRLSEDDILNPKLNVSCLDFLLIELVPLAQRITDQLHAREQALMEEFRKSKIFNSDDEKQDTSDMAKPNPAPTASVTGTAGVEPSTILPAGTTGGYMDEETREAVFWRLDDLGYRVGQGLVERMSVDRRAGARAGEDALRRAQAYLYFPCGVIRGALQGLGLDVTITAETTEIPSATFQIKTKGAKA
ncbi:hypothetical protein AC579_5862 [Pseudocercospora musae]|uniref:Trafficking protein particle complex subunit 6B n=1 Tax=Pseudocercospora musae TaxID=113226 RepID=A0A139IM34_9PEZI|nr:hypothetical protein AC579_5862 [Pseudocercospora musae]